MKMGHNCGFQKDASNLDRFSTIWFECSSLTHVVKFFVFKRTEWLDMFLIKYSPLKAGMNILSSFQSIMVKSFKNGQQWIIWFLIGLTFLGESLSIIFPINLDVVYWPSLTT